MRDNSIMHNAMQNQLNSSWNDDPFDLKGTFAGVANMDHKRNLYNYAEQLVGNYADFSVDHYDLSLDDLPEDEQNELVRLYLESTQREINECIFGDDFTINSEFTCSLLAMLQDNSEENQKIFAEITRKNTLIYFKESLNNLLIKSCDDYLNHEMDTQGYFHNQDLDHGDFFWSKF